MEYLAWHGLLIFEKTTVCPSQRYKDTKKREKGKKDDVKAAL